MCRTAGPNLVIRCEQVHILPVGEDQQPPRLLDEVVRRISVPVAFLQQDLVVGILAANPQRRSGFAGLPCSIMRTSVLRNVSSRLSCGHDDLTKTSHSALLFGPLAPRYFTRRNGRFCEQVRGGLAVLQPVQ